MDVKTAETMNNIEQSEIIIGCMSWGKWGKKLSTIEQSDLIKSCIDFGNTTFDHADIYGDYTTEGEFGKALKASGVKRDTIHIISKCGIQMIGESRSNKVKHYNLSKEYIISSVERSLDQLRTEYLDTLLLHRPSPLMNVTEIIQAANELISTGKILHFGVSNFTPSQIDLLSKDVEISTNQISFSITYPEPLFNGSLDHVQLKGISPQAWSPMGTVFKSSDGQTQRIHSVLDDLVLKYGVAKETILLSWILKHPAKISPVIGTTNTERIKNANKALELDLELEDWYQLLEASRGHRVA